jgi:hypothetical protein
LDRQELGAVLSIGVLQVSDKIMPNISAKKVVLAFTLCIAMVSKLDCMMIPLDLNQITELS